MQVCQHLGGHRVARFDRRRRFAIDDQLVAEIFEHDQAVAAVGGENFRRREVALVQSAGDGDEGRDAFGQMRDLAVRLAIAHRRAVRPLGRVHQDVTRAVAHQPLVGARRRVALDAFAAGSCEAAQGQEAADDVDALGARRKSTMAGDLDMTVAAAFLRHQREGDIETIRGQLTFGAVGPFQQRDGRVAQFLQAKLGQFVRPGESIEIGVDQREARQLVSLHQCEGGTRHLDGRIAGEVADERTGKGRLAGAEIAREGNEVARLDGAGDVAHQLQRRLLILQIDRKAVIAGAGRRHRIIRSRAKPL